MREQSLFLSNAWQDFEQSLAFIPDVLLITTVDGCIEQCSPSANLLFRTPENELINKSLLDFIAAEDQSQIESKIENLGRLQGVGRWDARIQPQDGPTLMAEFRMSRRRDLEHNNGTMVFWLIRDISQRKFIEDRLRLSERLATLGTFASNVAHELNNPLASLLLTARHALRSLNREDVISSCLNDIIADSERCAEIIKKLRIFAKKQYSQKIVVDLNSLMGHIETILQAVAGETGIVLSYKLSSEELPVSCNPTGLEQAITALIGGVLHNSERNSHIVVSTFPHKDKTRILIDDQVSGNGGGATEPQSGTQIPVSPAEVTSSGMGLITAYGIIHEHHGDLLTEARPGGRSATCIQLPRAEKPDPDAPNEITET